MSRWPLLLGSSRPHALRMTPLSRLTLALTLAGLSTQTAAAPDAAVSAQLQALTQRLLALEQRNLSLEQEVKGLRAAQAAPSSSVTPAAGNTPPGHAWGVERLDQLAQRVADLSRTSEAGTDDLEAEGISVEGGVLAVAQQVSRGGSETGTRQSRLNWRGDIEAALPLGHVAALGDARLSGFGHLRFGQGSGLALRPSHTATANSVPFEAGAGSDETYAIVAQAWAQLTWPLSAEGFNDQAGSRLEMTMGKMDVFGFFDQNAVAGDEGAQFLNNIFVHNPLLDSGGDIAADAYGLAPGVRLAYVGVGDDTTWGASLGVFGSGAGANFSTGPGKPLVIAQLEWAPLQINGDAKGNYRAYAWTNGNTADLAGQRQRHTGWGVSADQRVGRDWNLFGRWGQRTSGTGAFDRALTLGFELGGRGWSRGHDALGLAAGWVKTDAALQVEGLSGQEQSTELYYRLRLSEHLELSPDLQWIRRAGGNPNAEVIKVLGLRASIGF